MTRRRIVTFSSIFVVVTSTFCKSQQNPFPQTSDLSRVSIALIRHGCYGECPAYSVTISGRGKVVYRGNAFVRAVGEQTGQIPPGKVSELIKRINALRYFSLRRSYSDPRCPTDGPSAATVVSEPGRKKGIYNYCGAPKGLADLQDAIDKAANTKQWIFVDGPTLQSMVAHGWNVNAGGPEYIGHGWNVQGVGSEYMEEAISWNDPEVIRILVHAGVPVDGKNQNGDTYLLRAVMDNRYDAAKALLDLGANYAIPQEQMKNKPTPATSAGKNMAMAKLFLDKGADINAGDGHRDTMLMAAAEVGSLAAVKFLIASGAAVNVRNLDGQTPLGMAEQMRSHYTFDVKTFKSLIHKYNSVITYLEHHGAIR